MRRGAAIAAVFAALAAACGGPSADIDPFPIAVDLASGAVVAAADTGGTPFLVVVDTMSPITVVDPAATGQSAGAGVRRLVDVTLHAVTDAGVPSVARARFPGTTVYQLSPCGAGASSCAVGSSDTSTLPVDGVLGADALEGAAVRFDFAARTMRLFPDVAGTSNAWAKQCDAVLPAPFAGGGTLEIAGTEVSFAGLRPVIGACAQFAATSNPDTRGVDLLLVMSTGVGPSVISESAYARYQQFTGAPALADLPTGTVNFSSGPASVHIGQIDSLSLVGDVSNQRGPCTEVYANRVMRADACGNTKVVPSCPCANGNTFCSTAAAVDLSGPLQVAVLPDADPVLEGLRDELSPAQSDVDGILGTSTLKAVRVSLDYPNNRIIFHCLDSGSCVTSPAITDRSQRQDVLGCPKPPGSSLQ